MGPDAKIRFAGWTLTGLWGYATVSTALRIVAFLKTGPETSTDWFLLCMMLVGLAITFTATLFSYRYQARFKGSVRFATLSLRLLLTACALILLSLTWRATFGQILLTALMLAVWVLPHGAAYYLTRQYPDRFKTE